MEGKMNKHLLFVLGLLLIIILSAYCVYDLGRARAAVVDYLLVSEVYYDTIGNDSDEEWVEIYNPTGGEVDLSNYKIGDEETQGEGEGMYQFPSGASVLNDQTMVVAKNAVGFYELYGKYPDFEIDSSDDDISDFSQTLDMVKYSSWSTGSLSLTNSGDEIVLLDDGDVVVDAVVFEGGAYGGVTAHAGVATGHSIQREPINSDSDDCSSDFVDMTTPTPGYDWRYEGENYFHEIGSVDTDTSTQGGSYLKASTTSDNAGFLFFGPYATDQGAGMHQVLFRLRTNDNSNVNNAVRIDARNHDGSGTWVYREIKGTDFVANDEWQNFGLWFNRVEEGSMEFRVWFYDVVDLDFDNMRVGEVDRMVYEAEDMRHNTGSVVVDANASNGQAWLATTADSVTHMLFGPYEDLAQGNWEVNFVAKVSDNVVVDNVLMVDIYNSAGMDEYKNKILNGTDFAGSDTYQTNKLTFTRNDAGVMEYRAYYAGNADMTIDNIIVVKKDKIRYEAEDLYGATGNIGDDSLASGGKDRIATVGVDGADWMMFGPYTLDQTAGNYRATFRLKASDNTSSDAVALINVYNSGGSGAEEGLTIWGTDFTAVDEWQEFGVDFTRVEEGEMEYRVYFYDVSDISVDWVEIEKL
ncbi:lamin tail domain-containing protein [Patescibacteria group bacterium]|nr:lamin tail domain-containing protein [Patescibacteria group bacterium]